MKTALQSSSLCLCKREATTLSSLNSKLNKKQKTSLCHCTRKQAQQLHQSPQTSVSEGTLEEAPKTKKPYVHVRSNSAETQAKCGKQTRKLMISRSIWWKSGRSIHQTPAKPSSTTMQRKPGQPNAYRGRASRSSPLEQAGTLPGFTQKYAQGPRKPLASVTDEQGQITADSEVVDRRD